MRTTTRSSSSKIDGWSDLIYRTFNNEDYKCRFATTQTTYAEFFVELFETLDRIEGHLTDNTYLCGSKLTEAYWPLFPTLIGFDPVYHGHLKCNQRRIRDYPRLLGTLEDYSVTLAYSRPLISGKFSNTITSVMKQKIPAE